jgi:hypothetical protein
VKDRPYRPGKFKKPRLPSRSGSTQASAAPPTAAGIDRVTGRRSRPPSSQGMASRQISHSSKAPGAVSVSRQKASSSKPSAPTSSQLGIALGETLSPTIITEINTPLPESVASHTIGGYQLDKTTGRYHRVEPSRDNASAKMSHASNTTHAVSGSGQERSPSDSEPSSLEADTTHNPWKLELEDIYPKGSPSTSEGSSDRSWTKRDREAEVHIDDGIDTHYSGSPESHETGECDLNGGSSAIHRSASDEVPSQQLSQLRPRKRKNRS